MARKQPILWFPILLSLLVVLTGCHFNYNYSEGYGKPTIDVTPLPGLPESATLTSVSFSDNLHGWATAMNCPVGSTAACRGLIFRTADGGKSWVSTLPTLLTPRKVQFSDAKNGWFIGSIGQSCGAQVCPNEIMMTTDGGKEWDRASAVNVDLIDLSVVSPTNVWVLGRLCPTGAACRATLATTDSAGQIWANQDLPVKGSNFGLQRLDAKTAWVVALASGNDAVSVTQPRLAKTVDGGATWSTEVSPCPGKEQGSQFQSSAAGWLFCGGASGIHLYATADSGQTWAARGVIETRSTPTQSGAAVAGVARLVNGGAVVALSDGAIVVTDDGGATWKVGLRPGEPLHGLETRPGGDIWVLGSRHVYQSANSGQTWATQGFEYHSTS